MISSEIFIRKIFGSREFSDTTSFSLEKNVDKYKENSHHQPIYWVNKFGKISSLINDILIKRNEAYEFCKREIKLIN